MSLLVIPDIHNQVNWIENAIESINPSTVLFLGDYFDSFGDTKDQTLLTTNWLKNSLHIDNRIHLLGNHDISYLIPDNDYFSCPGNTYEKQLLINSVFTKEDWNKFKCSYFSYNTIFTHAGINPYLFHNLYILKDDLNTLSLYKYIEKEIEREFLSIQLGMKPLIFQKSPTRTNYRTQYGLTGGILWMDWDTEFKPISGISQVVGHTAHKSPKIFTTKSVNLTSSNLSIYKQNNLDLNICLDSNCSHLLLFEEQKIHLLNNTWISTKFN